MRATWTTRNRSGCTIREKLLSVSSVDQIPEVTIPGCHPYRGDPTLWIVDFIAVGDECTQCGVCAEGCPVGRHRSGEQCSDRHGKMHHVLCLHQALSRTCQDDETRPGHGRFVTFQFTVYGAEGAGILYVTGNLVKRRVAFRRRSLVWPAVPGPGARTESRRMKRWTSRIPWESPVLPGPAGRSSSRVFGPDLQAPLDRRDPDPRSCVGVQPTVMGMIRSRACQSSLPGIPNDPPAVWGLFSLRYCRAPVSCPAPCPASYLRAFSIISRANASAFRRSSASGLPLLRPPKYRRKLFVFHPAHPNSPRTVYPFACSFSRICEWLFVTKSPPAATAGAP